MKVKVLGILISLALCLTLAGVLAPPLSSPVMAATTWDVYPSTAGGIQGAINSAAAGDTIIVHSNNGNPYTYLENIAVNIQLTLQGEGSGVVTVQAADNSLPVFDVEADNVTLSGFTLTGGSDGIFILDADNCNIFFNNLTNNGFGGIFLWGAEGNTIMDCNATGNGLSSNGGGIWLTSSSDNNTIMDCNVNNNTYGIHLDSSYDNVIANSTINQNTVHGILLDNSRDNQIIGNNILNNPGSSKPPSPSGIHLTGSSRDNVIHFNNIVGNSPNGSNSYGVYNDYVNHYVTADNNWWGNATGPTHSGNPGGTGDAVTDYVYYSPWLGAPLVLPAIHHELLDPGTHVVDATAEADTKVTLDVSEEASETDIYIARYESQPFPQEPFPDTALGKYVDILLSNPEAVVWPIYVEVSYSDDEVTAAGINESSLGLYYYQSVDTFHRCSDTGVDTANNIIWANVTQEEAGYLVGTPFGAGGQLAHHAPAVPTLSQWGVIGMGTLFALALGWMARKRFAAKAGPAVRAL